MIGLSPLFLILCLGGLAFYAVTSRRSWFGGSETHGDSRWARASDLKLLRAKANGEGIVLGWQGRRLLTAPREDNVLAFGVQRSGKTTTLAIPSLLEWQGAAVATSTKDELVRLTGPHRLEIGPAYVFAPLDRDTSWVADLGLTNVSWNPLVDIEDSGAAAELADLFTADGKNSPSPHWYLSAANLLTGLFLMEHDRGGDLSRVLTTLNTAQLNSYATMTKAEDGLAHEILTGFSRTPEREAGSIASTARACLSLWLDQRVAVNTSSQSGTQQLGLDVLLRSGATLYLVAPAEDAERCRPLFSALLASLLRRATAKARSQGGVLSPRLLLVLDEVANFARIPRLASYVSTGPGQGIQTLLLFHDLAQLESLYGDQAARVIWNNCRARLLLPAQGDLKTLEYFSRAMGNETIVYDAKSRSKGGTSSHQQHLGRPLRSVDQLRRATKPVLLYANKPPAELVAKRWDEVPVWRTAVKGWEETEIEVPIPVVLGIH